MSQNDVTRPPTAPGTSGEVAGPAPTSWVQKTPDVCGGRACIRNTRITVWGLVQGRRLGFTEAQQLDNIRGLTPTDLQAAWDYYASHQAEIEHDIRQNEED